MSYGEGSISSATASPTGTDGGSGSGGWGDWAQAAKGGMDVLRGATDVAATIYALTNPRDRPVVPRQGYVSWIRNIPNMDPMLSGMMPMPFMEGMRYPSYTKPGPSETRFGAGDVYPATQEYYQTALSRNYGLSDAELEGRRQRMLASQGLGGLDEAYTPGQFAQRSYIDPEALAKAMTGIDENAYRDQQMYLQNAARLAQYNTRRAKMYGDLVGSAT